MSIMPSALYQVALPYDQPAKEVGVQIPIILATHSTQHADLEKNIYRFATPGVMLSEKMLR